MRVLKCLLASAAIVLAPWRDEFILVLVAAAAASIAYRGSGDSPEDVCLWASICCCWF